jgi:tetratricopeptide (TPR) repeat protein
MGNYVFPAVIIPLFICLFIIARFITVLLHELGHAIPALIFNKEKVTVFLGSYGVTKTSKHLPLGKRLSFYFKLNPFTWRTGMVIHSPENVSVRKNFIILFMGTCFPIFIAIVALWVVLVLNMNGFLKLFTLIFLLSALFDLRNLYSNNEPILLVNGLRTYNDGYQISKSLAYRKNFKIIAPAYKLYESERYAEAIKLFRKLNPVFIDNDVFVVVLAAYLHCKDFNGGKEFYQMMLKIDNRPSADSNIFCNIALTESLSGNHYVAMEFYNKSIELDGKNTNSISNRGYTRSLLEQFDEAINDFNIVIEIEPKSAYAFANRGYAKTKLSLIEEGLTDINEAISLDNTNSYAYRNLGLYYFDQGNYQEAATNFQLAYNLDSNTHMIEEFKKMTADKLNITA